MVFSMPIISHYESASSDSALMSSYDSHDTTDLTALDTPEDSPPPSKRRKISSDQDSFVSSPFTVGIPCASPASQEFSLTPTALLPRSHLALSWLDPFVGSTDGFPGLLFRASIPNLEDDLTRHDDTAVLAVRSNDEGDLYAIERVKKGMYALYDLADWLSDTDLLVASKEWLKPPAITKKSRESDTFEEYDETDWRRAAEASSNGLDLEAKSDVDISMAFGPDKPTSLSDEAIMADDDVLAEPGYTEDNQSSFNSSDAGTAEASISLLPFPDGKAESAEPTPLEVLERLRTQYLEALYLSKTSVGYFAKGPLSRSRTALRKLSDKDKTLTSVTSIYHNGILTMKKMDIKYRETLPNIISSVLPALSDESVAHYKPSIKTKSKRNKKIGRNGLYPEEEPLVEVWWRNRHATENSSSVFVSKEAEIKEHVSELRLREMQLQVLWILETIDMEASMEGNPTDTDAGKSSNLKKKRSKKSRDVDVSFELLLDRLCIWRTVSFGESLSADGVNTHDKIGHNGGGEKLQDFCTEIILPFYASRLPEHCRVVDMKLRGSGAISPIRQKRPQPQRTRLRPGEPVERINPLNPRRGLQRVLTDEKITLRSNAPPLIRSNTTPTAPEIKRKPSEPPSLQMGFRGGIQNANRFDNREVDLNSTAKEHEAKLKRMNNLMEQKKELDIAIDRLRRPNRELVAREFAESGERRSSISRRRKQTNPVRNPLGHGVQVMATPRANRKKNTAGGYPCQTPSQSTLFREQDPPVHNTDVQVVPSSHKKGVTSTYNS